MDKVIRKDKKTKKRMKQPFLMERDNVGEKTRNMDNHQIEDYHDYERMFDGKPMLSRRDFMDKVIKKKAGYIEGVYADAYEQTINYFNKLIPIVDDMNEMLEQMKEDGADIVGSHSEEFEELFHRDSIRYWLDKARELTDSMRETSYNLDTTEGKSNTDKVIIKKAEGFKEIYTLEELESMPTISKGHTDDLKYEDDDTRVWLSRMTVEDGMPYNNQVTVEKYEEIDGSWIWHTVDEYEAE
jgi:hypothetical protein